MGHSHGHHHDHHDHGHSTRNITLAFWLNTAFAIIEIIGGLYTNSVAILSDALHDFGDSLSLGLSWYFQKKSEQKRDPAFSYGYKRFSLLGAFINSLVLIIGSVFILQEAITRLSDPQNPDAKGMVILAILGIVFAVALYIVFNVYKNLRSVLRIVLQGMPENVDEEEIRKKVTAIAGVSGVHDIHAWSMDGQYNILTLHVVVNDKADLQQIQKIKDEVRHCLQHLHVNHITIETENDQANCGLENC
jgi:cobalt-zinc-cadmium efflux system protein